MKKHFLFAAVAALMTCACSVEPVDVVDVQPEEEGEFTVLTAGFAGAEDETRTVRQADGKVFWSPGDAISILRGSKNAKFTASNTEPAASATLSGTMPSGTANYWAVYPYSSSNNIQNGYMVTMLSNQQKAVAGSFADGLFISAAYVKNSTTSLKFYHQVGGIKFTLTQPGIKRVTLIPADEDVCLAGLIGLYAASAGKAPYIAATGSADDMYNTIELDAPEGETLQVGEAYHFVTMPAYLSGGFTLLFEKEDGSIASQTIEKDVEIQAAHFVSLKDVDKHVTFRKDYLNYSPSAITIDGLGGAFAIHVNGTLEYKVESSTEWIHEVSVTGDVRIDRTHAYCADRNETGATRYGVVSVCYENNCYPVLVTQGPMGDLKVLPHHTLGMRFTATWCQHCPTMDETFRKAKAAMGDAFEYVCIYAPSGNYSFSGSDALANQYKIAGFPSGRIDGWFDLPNYSSTDYGASAISQVAQQSVQYYPTATVLGIESSLSGRQLSVKVDVKAQYEEDYKLTIFLCENDIIGNQQKGSTVVSNFNHSRVTRMSLTAVSGDLFEGPVAGQVKSLNYTAAIPAEYKLENMEVVAFVQRCYNDRPSLASGNYGNWYVDNCRSAKLGTTAPLEAE